jgi:hypothetical protein
MSLFYQKQVTGMKILAQMPLRSKSAGIWIFEYGPSYNWLLASLPIVLGIAFGVLPLFHVVSTLYNDYRLWGLKKICNSIGTPSALLFVMFYAGVIILSLYAVLSLVMKKERLIINRGQRLISLEKRFLKKVGMTEFSFDDILHVSFSSSTVRDGEGYLVRRIITEVILTRERSLSLDSSRLLLSEAPPEKWAEELADFLSVPLKTSSQNELSGK